jgi:inosine/xanthosine triphosphatase
MVVVCVGSLNPTKIEGVKRAFTPFFSSIEVRGCAVDTGLPPQPIGLDMTMRGASIRAEKALNCYADCEFGVGIEAGFIEINGTYYDVQVACIVRRDGAKSFGFSPAFPLPKRFVEPILAGVYKELEEAVDRYYGTERIGERGGFIKLLTRGVITREDLSFAAVVMALVPFINRELYELNSIMKQG